MNSATRKMNVLGAIMTLPHWIWCFLLGPALMSYLPGAARLVDPAYLMNLSAYGVVMLIPAGYELLNTRQVRPNQVITLVAVAFGAVFLMSPFVWAAAYASEEHVQPDSVLMLGQHGVFTFAYGLTVYASVFTECRRLIAQIEAGEILLED